MIVDADGLTLVGEHRELVDREPPTVLTPHDREFERVAGPVGDDRLGAARRAAAELGVTMLLKGNATVVARPDGVAYVNPTGTPWLGTAGSGDVLSGLIGSLLAAGLEPALAAAVGRVRARRRGPAGRRRRPAERPGRAGVGPSRIAHPRTRLTPGFAPANGAGGRCPAPLAGAKPGTARAQVGSRRAGRTGSRGSRRTDHPRGSARALHRRAAARPRAGGRRGAPHPLPGRHRDLHHRPQHQLHQRLRHRVQVLRVLPRTQARRGLDAQPGRAAAPLR